MPFIAGNQPPAPVQPNPQAQQPAMGQNQPTPVQQAPRQMPQQAWGMQQQFPRQNQGMQPYGRPQMPPWAQGRFGGQMGPRGPMDIGSMGQPKQWAPATFPTNGPSPRPDFGPGSGQPMSPRQYDPNSVQARINSGQPQEENRVAVSPWQQEQGQFQQSAPEDNPGGGYMGVNLNRRTPQNYEQPDDGIMTTIARQPGQPMRPDVMPPSYGQPGPGLGSDGRFGMAQDRLMRQSQQPWRSGPMDIGGMGKMGPGRMQGVSNPWGEQVHSTIPQQPIQQEDLGTPMRPDVMPDNYGQPGPGMGSDGRFGMAQDRLMRQSQQPWRSGPMDLGPQFYY